MINIIIVEGPFGPSRVKNISLYGKNLLNLLMEKLQPEEEIAIVQFCKLVEEVSHFLKKSNKHYPIRKNFLSYKKNLVSFLYNHGYCYMCQELVQKNPNMIDKSPYIIVKMGFYINDSEIVFHTPKSKIDWEYKITKSYDDVQIFPQEIKHFSMDQVFKINGILKTLFRIDARRHRRMIWERIYSLLDWQTSDTLREINKTGVFDTDNEL